jgi:hypothetical protein
MADRPSSSRTSRERNTRRLRISLATAAALLMVAGAVRYAHDASRGEPSSPAVARTTPASPQPERSTPAANLAAAEQRCSTVSTLKRGPACGAWWGIYTPPVDNSILRPVTTLEDKIGRRFDIVFTYHDMSETENGTLLRGEEPRLGRNRILLLGWESERWDTGDSIPWKDIAAGEIDSTVIDPQARRVKAYGKPVMIGFDGEMETRTDSGTPAQYVAAYRHIIGRFRKLGVTNVTWVWGVTGWLPYKNRWKAFYPGDGYIDWISYDPYNFAECRGASWRSFEQTVKPAYDWFVRNGFGDKPFIISEYGSETHSSRPKARGEWYADVPDVLKALPNIKAVLQWNAVDDRDCDFTLKGPGVLKAFGQAGKDPHFRQPLPRSAR